MKVSCPHCGAGYALDPDKVPAKGAWTRCRRCDHRFFVPPPEERAGIHCVHCAVGYTVVRERVPEQGVEVRCRVCRRFFRIPPRAQLVSLSSAADPAQRAWGLSPDRIVAGPDDIAVPPPAAALEAWGMEATEIVRGPEDIELPAEPADAEEEAVTEPEWAELEGEIVRGPADIEPYPHEERVEGLPEEPFPAGLPPLLTDPRELPPLAPPPPRVRPSPPRPRPPRPAAPRRRLPWRRRHWWVVGIALAVGIAALLWSHYPLKPRDRERLCGKVGELLDQCNAAQGAKGEGCPAAQQRSYRRLLDLGVPSPHAAYWSSLCGETVCTATPEEWRQHKAEVMQSCLETLPTGGAPPAPPAKEEVVETLDRPWQPLLSNDNFDSFYYSRPVGNSDRGYALERVWLKLALKHGGENPVVRTLRDMAVTGAERVTTQLLMMEIECSPDLPATVEYHDHFIYYDAAGREIHRHPLRSTRAVVGKNTLEDQLRRRVCHFDWG